MRIYSMTATFGKLEQETLTLQPGLNILHAPNEWGKSTWCAFLLAMLYGLDTRAKTTKTALADKERFAPWSGKAMEGRVDLRWQDRDITIERRTKGRIPLGEFRAYETATGLPIPELTAANCGEVLLGVEQGVFRRSGFIRLSDLPVTADEDLRRRLNALVTTGDESGDAERLARSLKELRNRCRHNRTGLIPQTEAEREKLENKLAELDSLEHHSAKLKRRLGEVNSWLRQLKNHQAALAYAGAEADECRVAEARDACASAVARLEALERRCAALPTAVEAEQKLRELERFREEWSEAQQARQVLPELSEPPAAPAPFENMTFAQAEDTLGEDLRRYELRRRSKPWLLWLFFGGALLVLAALAVGDWGWMAAWLALPGIFLSVLGLVHRRKWRAEAAALEETYGSADPDQWTALLETWREDRQLWERTRLEQSACRAGLDRRLEELEKRRASLCGGQSPEQVADAWQKVLDRWEEYSAARREALGRERHLQDLQAMARSAPKPVMADDLTYTEGETGKLLSEAEQEQQRLQNRLGQYQGRMEALGEEGLLQKELDRVNTRLKKLEDTYSALTIALETLNDARLELQRRFAPRITKGAQERMALLTNGRYDRLTLGEDFSLHAGAVGENTMSGALWRSDGTVDQLYLALRLAVAAELTPDGPLVLDDALVRFDDARMGAALALLRREAETKQVILFSCQKRELEAEA